MEEKPDMPGATKSDVALREEKILTFWNESQIFKKSVERPATKGEYTFYDGPPFATGLPHYGHIITSVVKDVIPRYKTMQGYSVPRRWGWDCHGLPIENIVEKELGFKHKKDIEALGIVKFNELCRSKVMTYADDWKQIIPRFGRWADMDDPYFTMSRDFMESVWWVFKQLYDKGLVYENYRTMHICPRCETTLSQQEVSEGYKDVKDLSVTAKFKLSDPTVLGFEKNHTVYVLAWTTTPWTLPGNVALAVGSDIDYMITTVENGDSYIFAKEYLTRVDHALFFTDGFEGKESLFKLVKGKDLVGLSYVPLFDYYSKDTALKNHERGWKIYAADFVTTESGTGIVHEASAFGEVDMQLAKKENLPFIQHVGMDGIFKSEVTDFVGIDLVPRAKNKPEEIREADLTVVKFLTEKGLVFESKKYEHSYPHCWRCDTALLNYATSSWFVKIEQLKPDFIKTAENINWSPKHIKEGLFGHWLEGARDWSISRQRFWASVIPLWRCEACKSDRVFGSAGELEEVSGKKINDLHKHIVDEIGIPCSCGGEMKRIPDVLDTWFDSGSMPYGQSHYPFHNKEKFEASFPAHFISEFTGQFRAWFYYLHILSTALFNTNAFQNAIVHGVVLGEDGRKMSKKLQNYPDPLLMADKYGADAMRLYFMSSPVVSAENLNFSESGVAEIQSRILGRLNNVLSFYELYKDSTGRSSNSTNVLDVWILARLAELLEESTNGFETYQIDVATRPIAGFIDDLSTWYLRRSRDRMKSEGDDKTLALSTLRYVLHTLSLIIAPTMPFYAEYLFQAVKEKGDEESVHLALWPEAETGTHNPVVIESMKTVRAVVTLALEAREKAGVKVRQPLSLLSIPDTEEMQRHLNEDMLQIIMDEVNIKGVMIQSSVPVGEVILDSIITPELKEEGFIRDVIRAIQNLRKEKGLSPHDKVALTIDAGDANTIIERYTLEIKKVTNVSEISLTNTMDTKQIIGEYSVGLGII